MAHCFYNSSDDVGQLLFLFDFQWVQQANSRAEKILETIQGEITMSADFLKPSTEHICKDYYLEMNAVLSQCHSQITNALRRHRLKKETEFDIYGIHVSLDQVISAAVLFLDSRQAPHFEMNLFDKENPVIKKAIHDLESFLKKVHKIIGVIQIPDRPQEVDRWIKR